MFREANNGTHEARRARMLDQSYISALAALAGSAIGGLTTLGAAWVTQNRQENAQRIAQEKSKRQELYKNFIDDASQFYAYALAHDQAKLSALVSMYASVSQMRVISNPTVVKKAEAVVRAIVDTYFAPNKTFPELRQMIDNHRSTHCATSARLVVTNWKL
jgi:hypothetical protein